MSRGNAAYKAELNRNITDAVLTINHLLENPNPEKWNQAWGEYWTNTEALHALNQSEMLNDDFNTPTPPKPDGFITAQKATAALFDKMLKTTVVFTNGSTNPIETRNLHKFARKALLRIPYLTTRNELEELHTEGITRLQTYPNLAA